MVNVFSFSVNTVFVHVVSRTLTGGCCLGKRQSGVQPDLV